MYLSGTLVTERDFNVLRWSRGAECKQRSCIKDVLGAGSRKAMHAACQYGCVGLWLMALVSRLGRSSNVSFGCLGLSREWKVQMKPQGRVLEVEEKFTGVLHWLPSTRTWSWREGKQETSPPVWENPASCGHGHGRRELYLLSRVLSLALAAPAGLGRHKAGCAGFVITFDVVSSDHHGFQSASCARDEEFVILAKFVMKGLLRFCIFILATWIPVLPNCI